MGDDDTKEEKAEEKADGKPNAGKGKEASKKAEGAAAGQGASEGEEKPKGGGSKKEQCAVNRCRKTKGVAAWEPAPGEKLCGHHQEEWSKCTSPKQEAAFMKQLRHEELVQPVYLPESENPYTLPAVLAS